MRWGRFQKLTTDRILDCSDRPARLTARGGLLVIDFCWPWGTSSSGEAVGHSGSEQNHVVWFFAMFALPVDKPRLQHKYATFRAALRRLGFTMLQYSV